MPTATELRTKVRLQREIEVKDDFDEKVKTWATVAVMWCKIEETSGGETIVGGQRQATVQARIETRYRHDVRTSDRLQATDGRVYAIESVTDFENQKRRWMFIDAVRKGGT